MKLYCVLIFLVLYVHLNKAEDISFDYYFGRAGLRSDGFVKNKCEDTLYEYKCLNDCPRDHVCFMRSCICVDVGVDERLMKKPILYHRTVDEEVKEDELPPGFVDLTKASAQRPFNNFYLKPDSAYEEYPSKPVLRHHIAHFCPNLDIARKCIRKCIPLGKPAFCGKDHVCYCGHRYHHLPNDKDRDIADGAAVYTQFKDMYKKYFGDNYNPNAGTETTTQQIHSTSEED